MAILSELVELLSAYASDTIPVAEADIRQFANDHQIALREDHLRLLARFGCPPDQRPAIFAWYEGDFDFDLFKSVYLDDYPDMARPSGTTFFGTNFVGDSFCIDTDSGKIFAYDEGERFGRVHESIDGFLLRCLVAVYDAQAFANKVVTRDLTADAIKAFRLQNEPQKLSGATYYQLAYEVTETLVILAEYYFVDGQLMVLNPVTHTLIVYTGGVLDKLTT